MDCILMDFSKAFDKVLHSRLLMKLQHYEVRGHLHDWITSFLLGRTQCVVHMYLMANHQLPQPFLQEYPRELSWNLSYSYFSLTTCHLSSHQPSDCLQMTVFCIEGSERQRIRPFYRETWTTCKSGKTTG